MGIGRFFVSLGRLYIVLSRMVNLCKVSFLRRPRYFCRLPHRHAPRRDLHPFGDDGSHGHDTATADSGPVHDDRFHADQDVVLHGRPMHDGPVPHRHAVAKSTGKAGIGVEHAEILHVRPFADADRFAVATNYRPKPDAGFFADGHIAKYGRAWGYKAGRGDQLGPELGIRVFHATPLLGLNVGKVRL